MDDKTFRKLSSMLNNSSNTCDNNTFSNFFNSKNTARENSSNSNFDFSNLDFETLNKMKNLMGKFQSNQHSPRVNLLNSLKPYLKPSRKEKLDQYIQFANMISIMETFGNMGDGKK